MSQYLPTVAWSTIASNVTLGASAYRYYITVNPLDPNEAGASPMTVAIDDWFIDFAGYPFLIEEVNGSVLTVYDILERGDGVISAYAPYANQLGYVYRPINNAFLLSQSQLRKLDRSAADVIQNIEKAVIQKSINEKATNNPGISAETPITAQNISINYTTRVLTITPPLGYFDFFTDGGGVVTKHTKTGSVDFPAFTNTSGLWYFYFDSNGDPIATQVAWTDFTTIAPVMRVVWNSAKSPDSAKAVAEFIEYHINDISAIDHAWKHKYGAIWLEGLDIFNNAQLSGSPNADGRNTVIALSSGTNIDDNLPYTITNDTTPTTYWEQDLGLNNNSTLNATNSALLKIRYKGVGGSGELEAATRFPFLWNTGTNRPQYVNGSGVKTLVSNGYFFVYFVYAVQDGRVGNTIRLTPAYAEYSSITNARAVTWETVQTQDEVARDTEIRPLYRLIFEYKSAYNVGCKYTLLCEVQDIRKTIITQTTLSAGSIAASSVTYTPTLPIVGTNVQTALDYLATHTHYQLYQPDNTNPFVYTDNSGQLHIDGNIIQTGTAYETHAEQVYTKDNIIILREGAISGLGVGEYAGFTAKLYDGVNDGQLVFDNAGVARVGDLGSLQPIATRIETPTNGQFAYWEGANTRLNFKTLGVSDISGLVSSQWVTSGSDIYYNGGNVGIGTSSPNSNGGASSRVLHLNSDNNSWSFLHVTNSATGKNAADGTLFGMINNDAYIFNYENANLILATAGAERMIIDNNGNVGIGTTTPAYGFESVLSTASLGNKTVVIGGGNEIWTQPQTNSTAALYINYRGYADGLSQFRDLYIANGKGTIIASFVGASGNVGIGRTPTTYKCEISGDLFATGGWLRNDGARGWYNETYGGGIYMTDSTYVRIYNAKKFKVDNTVDCTDAKIGTLSGVLKAANGVVSSIPNTTAGYVLTATGSSTPPEFLPQNNRVYNEYTPPAEAISIFVAANSFNKIICGAGGVELIIPRNASNSAEECECVIINNSASAQNITVILYNVSVFPTTSWIGTRPTQIPANKKYYLKILKFGNPASVHDAVIKWEEMYGDVVAGLISVSPSLLAFLPSSSKQVIQISAASGTSYTLSDDQSWITLEKSSSSGNDFIDVTVSTNSSTDSRVGTITITSSSMTLYVTVSQYGAGYDGSSSDPLTGAQICAMLHPGDPSGFQSCLDAYAVH